MKSLKYAAYAGWVYVLFWIVGLALEPASPGVAGSTVDLTNYYATHQMVHLIQSYLIDGAAGIAFLVFVAACAGYFLKIMKEEPVLPLILFGFGVAAASISLIQAGFQQALSSNLLSTGEIPLRLILIIINYLDTFKLLGLAGFSVILSILIAQTNAISRWIGWMSDLLAVLLFLGGLSYLIDQPVLRYLLYLSLPGLLILVAAMSIKMIQSTSSQPQGA